MKSILDQKARFMQANIKILRNCEMQVVNLIDKNGSKAFAMMQLEEYQGMPSVRLTQSYGSIMILH